MKRATVTSFGPVGSDRQQTAHTQFCGARATRRAYMLVETLVSLACTVLIGAAILSFIRINMVSTKLTMDQHSADQQARRPLDNVADCVRKAQGYGTGQAVIALGTASSITIYDDLLGNTSQYWLDTSSSPYRLKRTRTAGTVQLATGVQSLLYTYYLASGLTPAQGSAWTATANPNAPTTTEMPNIVAVRITLTVTIDGTTRTFTTPVRLRNGSRAVSGN